MVALQPATSVHHEHFRPGLAKRQRGRRVQGQQQGVASASGNRHVFQLCRNPVSGQFAGPRRRFG